MQRRAHISVKKCHLAVQLMPPHANSEYPQSDVSGRVTNSACKGQRLWTLSSWEQGKISAGFMTGVAAACLELNYRPIAQSSFPYISHRLGQHYSLERSV